MIPNSAAHRYKQAVYLLAHKAGLKPLGGAVELHIAIVPKAKKNGEASEKLFDLDNGLKVLIDAVQGTAYHNDRQIRKIVAGYADGPKEGGGVIVEIRNFGEQA